MKATFVASSRLLCFFALWYSAVVVEVTSQGELVQKVGQIASGSCATVKKVLNIDDLEEAIRPSDVDQVPVHFKSRELEKTFTLSNAGSEIAKLPGYKPHAPLIVLLQGLTGIPDEPDFSSISKALLKKGDYSIISVRVGTIVDFLTLKSPTVRRIGERMGEMLGAMAHEGLDPPIIHLIGHSLGANMASYAAKMFTKATGNKVGRISGLDPAGPCFSNIDPDLRLKAEDATFVDVIHTDDGVLGYEYRVGHVDFYPNGGKLQPNCFVPTCSHGRAMELFAASISDSEAFLATACDQYKSFEEGKCSKEISVMGFDCDKETKGNQYLRTGEKYPYGLGENGAFFKNLLDLVSAIPTTVTSGIESLSALPRNLNAGQISPAVTSPTVGNITQQDDEPLTLASEIRLLRGDIEEMKTHMISLTHHIKQCCTQLDEHEKKLDNSEIRLRQLEQRESEEVCKLD